MSVNTHNEGFGLLRFARVFQAAAERALLLYAVSVGRVAYLTSYSVLNRAWADVWGATEFAVPSFPLSQQVTKIDQ